MDKTARAKPQTPIWASALSWLALAAAAGGLHWGYAAGAANRALILDHSADAALYYRASQNYDFPLPVPLQSFNYLFPDIGATLGLSHLFGSPYAAIHAYAALCLFVLAGGCWLLARRLGGMRAALFAPPAAGLMALLAAHPATEELFAVLFAASFRNGLMALQPLLLYLSVSVLFAESGAKAKKYAAALGIILFFLHASFVLVKIWFAIPAAAGLILIYACGVRPPRWKIFAGALIGAYLAAEILRAPLVGLFFESAALNQQAVIAKFNPQLVLIKMELMAIWASAAAARHPLQAAVWIAFSGLCIWTAFCGLRRRASPETPDGAQTFAAVFFLIAVAAGPAAAVISGRFDVWGRLEHFANHRYFEPSIYWPLFLGWPALLGFWLPRIFRRVFPNAKRAEYAAPVFAAAVLLLAAPLWRHLPEAENLRHYGATPFSQCIARNAEKHNLKQGIAAADLAVFLSSHAIFPDKPIPTAAVLNVIPYFKLIQQPLPAGAPPFQKNIDKHQPGLPGDIKPGEFNFIVINETDEIKLHASLPESPRCPHRLAHPEKCFDEGKYGWIGYHFITGETAAHYGEPASRFRCSGVDFYLYENGFSLE